MEAVWVVGKQNADRPIADILQRVRLNPSCAAAMRPYVKLLWPLVVLWL